MVSSDEELVNIFNTYFVSVFTDERSESSYVREQSNDSFVFLNIDNEIKELLEYIDYNKPAFPDGIHHISYGLYLIFNRSFNYCEIAEDLKIAFDVPIYKVAGMILEIIGQLV